VKGVFLRTLMFAALSTPLSLGTLHPRLASAEAASEAQVKAAFLFRFTHYVRWPASAAPVDNVTIAILGDDPVASELLKLAQSRKAKGDQLHVQRISSVTEGFDAHVLYVSANYRGDLRETLKAVAERPVLTVTDAPNALDLGAVVNFMIADRRVRFEVSVLSAQRAGIHVSPELLSVAARVISAQVQADADCGVLTVDQEFPECLQRVART